jgi:hypothetical protein
MKVLKWVGIIIGAFVVLVILVNIFGGSEGEPVQAPMAKTTVTATVEQRPTEVPPKLAPKATSKPAPTATPKPQPTPTAKPEPTPTPTTVPEPEPQEFKGVGARVSPQFDLQPGLATFEMTHDGSSNFAVTLLSADGDTVDLLANDIGPFNGTAVIGVREGTVFGARPGRHILNIEADGNWSIILRQPRFSSAPEPPQTFKGKGMAMSPAFMLDEGLVTFSFTHDGKSNFAVALLSAEGDTADLLVNEIGPFEGSKAVGVKARAIMGAKPGIHVLKIDADGNWTVSLSR